MSKIAFNNPPKKKSRGKKYPAFASGGKIGKPVTPASIVHIWSQWALLDLAQKKDTSLWRPRRLERWVQVIASPLKAEAEGRIKKDAAYGQRPCRLAAGLDRVQGSISPQGILIFFTWKSEIMPSIETAQNAPFNRWISLESDARVYGGVRLFSIHWAWCTPYGDSILIWILWLKGGHWRTLVRRPELGTETWTTPKYRPGMRILSCPYPWSRA